MSERAGATMASSDLEENAQLTIVLGGTNPHRALVQNLKQRGYRVLLADYLEAPPAADAADEHVRVSALDVEAVHRLATERKASLVISVCLDRAIPVVAEVSRRLGLPSIYTPENALRFTDKVTSALPSFICFSWNSLLSHPSYKQYKAPKIQIANIIKLLFRLCLFPVASTAILVLPLKSFFEFPDKPT